MNNESGTFYAKIMLFGEYSVIVNSMALAIPYTHFKGELRFIGGESAIHHAFATESNKQLKEFSGHLKGTAFGDDAKIRFDTDRLDSDISKGLYFDSSIPQGYGIGSSGALCAALYHHYAIDAIHLNEDFSQEEARQLRSVFAGMESYFHGRSSGLDPLLCHIRQPLLIREDKQPEIVRIPREPLGNKGTVFLVDTGITGKTGPLVNLFNEKVKSTTYRDFISHQLVPVTHACINTFLEGEPGLFFGHMKQLSEMQLSHFQEMIPSGFLELWKEGLITEDYFMKLCGSGGGGFLLGMAPDIGRATKSLQGAGISPVIVC